MDSRSIIKTVFFTIGQPDDDNLVLKGLNTFITENQMFVKSATAPVTNYTRTGFVIVYTLEPFITPK
jgi:hypothetical protein